MSCWIWERNFHILFPNIIQSTKTQSFTDLVFSYCMHFCTYSSRPTIIALTWTQKDPTIWVNQLVPISFGSKKIILSLHRLACTVSLTWSPLLESYNTNRTVGTYNSCLNTSTNHKYCNPKQRTTTTMTKQRRILTLSFLIQTLQVHKNNVCLLISPEHAARGGPQEQEWKWTRFG